MASRKTIRINFVGIPSQLKELVSEIPDHAQFIKRHGYLLDLVISGFEEDMMHVLFQFFDPKHHCFTFPDYQDARMIVVGVHLLLTDVLG